MVRVEGGTYIMGQPDPDLGGEGWSSDECSHTVQVAPFSIGVTEVTQAQWKSVMGSKDTPTEFDGEDLPVERVSWSDNLYQKIKPAASYKTKEVGSGLHKIK